MMNDNMSESREGFLPSLWLCTPLGSPHVELTQVRVKANLTLPVAPPNPSMVLFRTGPRSAFDRSWKDKGDTLGTALNTGL